MIGRVQMMREAVDLAHATGGADGGPLTGPVALEKGEGVFDDAVSALKIIGAPYTTLDARFFADLDTGGGDFGTLPRGLIVANAQGGQYVPMKWSRRAVTFDRREFGLKSITVPLAADDAWERLIAAIEMVVTDFFDRNQPRLKMTPVEAQGVFDGMRKGVNP